MGKPRRILTVDDCQDRAELLVRGLQSGGYDLTFECVCSPNALTQALATNEWNVLNSKRDIPAFTGLAALALVQASGFELTDIVVTEIAGEEAVVAAMKAGASGYVSKERSVRLSTVIDRELRRACTRRNQVQ